MPPLAAIDLGTNTVRLLVAEVEPDRGLRVLETGQVVARLGEGLSRRGTLGPEPMARALAAVRRFRDRALALGAERVLVVATAAVREADNAAALLDQLAADRALAPRVVSGPEEARLTLLGVTWGLPEVGEPYAVLDLGGGSTELIVARGPRALGAVSLRLGVVALHERFFRADPVDGDEYAACAAHVAERLRVEARPVIGPLAPRALVGTAGTITTLAALDLALPAYDAARVHGHRLPRPRVEALRAWLGAMPVAARAALPALEPGRADLIVPGIAVALGVLDCLGLDALTVSDTGLREGVLLDAVGWRPPAG